MLLSIASFLLGLTAVGMNYRGWLLYRFVASLENWWTLMTYWKSLNMFCADHVCPSGCVSPNIRARTVGQRGFFFFFKIRFGGCRSIRFSSLFIYNERTFPKAMNGLCRILRVKVKLCLHTPWRRTESGGIAPHILKIGTRCGRHLHFLPLYYWWKSHRYLLSRRPGWPQGRSGCFGENPMLQPQSTWDFW